MTVRISIIGLGPGELFSMTRGSFEIMKTAKKIMVRTAKHPAVGEMKVMGLEFTTFDALYEKYDDFNQVYTEIAQAVIMAARELPVVYAVPGHPLVGEESVIKIINQARMEGIPYQVFPAMSFLDPVLAALEVDLSRGLKVVDGLQLCDDGEINLRPDPQIPNLIMQVYNSLIASDVKLTLMQHFPDEHPVTLIRGAGIKDLQRIETVPLYELDRLDWFDHLTCVYIPPCPASKTMVSMFPMDRLVDIMERLRGPRGCPWDREQNHESLKKYLVEETYEVLDAIDEGNMYKVCEELGDLLLQIAFHAQIARESGFFDLNDVVAVISEKLVRRHPHVFGTAEAANSEQVSANWEEIKKGELREKGEIRESLLDGIPRHLPALMKADKIQKKAAKVGFDWPDYQGALAKAVEELQEVKEAVSEGDARKIQDEVGDLIFAAVNLARLLNVNAEEALLGTVQKFRERFAYMERRAEQENRELQTMELAKLDNLWEEAKFKLKNKENEE